MANNERAGIKYCADNSLADRSHNLFYRNFKESCATGGLIDCRRMCRWRTLGTCIAPGVNCGAENSWMDAGASFPGAWATGEICGQDPLFDTDYTLLSGSPAIGTGSDTNDMGAFGGSDPIMW